MLLPVALLTACASGEVEANGGDTSSAVDPASSDVEASSSADASDSLTVTSTSYASYTFELDVDGDVYQTTAMQLGVVEAYGPDCDTRWVLTSNGVLGKQPSVGLQLYSDAEPAVGTSGNVGNLGLPDHKSKISFITELSELLGEVHGSYEITKLGIDELEIVFTGGNWCTEKSTLDGSACPPFQQATLRLLPSDRTFDPATLYCCEDDWTSGEQCTGRAIDPYRDVELCP
jgi:hypothetical protein